MEGEMHQNPRRYKTLLSEFNESEDSKMPRRTTLLTYEDDEETRARKARAEEKARRERAEQQELKLQEGKQSKQQNEKQKSSAPMPHNVASSKQLDVSPKELLPYTLPTQNMSKEELWYPVTFAQRKKEQEEIAWAKNNPNASVAELFYPSMRKASVPPQPVVETSNKQQTNQGQQ